MTLWPALAIIILTAASIIDGANEIWVYTQTKGNIL